MSNFPSKHNQHSGLSMVVEFLTNFCILFTVTMIVVFLPWLYAMGSSEVQDFVLYMFKIVGMLVIVGIVQAIFFSHLLIKKASYPTRLALFGICNYAALALYAWVMQIVPVADPSNWLTFTGVYLVIFILMTAIFGLLYHFKEKSLNEQLTRFKEAHKA